MTKSELRQLYINNELVEAIIEPAAQDGYWIVEFRHEKGGFVPLTNEDGEDRRYTDLDEASESALEVGFYQVRVESK